MGSALVFDAVLSNYLIECSALNVSSFSKLISLQDMSVSFGADDEAFAVSSQNCFILTESCMAAL